MYWYVRLTLAVVFTLIVAGVCLLLRPYVFHSTTRATGVATTDNVPLPAAPLPPTLPGRSLDGAPALPPIAPPIAATSPEAAEKLSQAKQNLDQGQLLAARKLLDALLQDPGVQPFAEPWTSAVALLNQINSTLVLTDAPSPEEVNHVVVKGDTLSKLAKEYSTTIAMIQKNNHLDPTNPIIQLGQSLRIYKANWSILVSKSHYSLLLKDGDRLVKVYPVGIGRQDRTPLGTFRIAAKVTEPAWTNKGKTIPYGDKDNVLGTRWMKLEATGTTDKSLLGYGIHGTWEPESVGTPASNGCVRLRNTDVEELFDIVPQGISVVIEE